MNFLRCCHQHHIAVIAIIVIMVLLRYVLFERSARQSLAWIKEEGDIYLNTHTQVIIIMIKLSKGGDVGGDHEYENAEHQVGSTLEETEQLLAEHNSFKEKARETREKVEFFGDEETFSRNKIQLFDQVKLLLQLADTLVEKGHAHAPNIKQWVEEVRN